MAISQQPNLLLVTIDTLRGRSSLALRLLPRDFAAHRLELASPRSPVRDGDRRGAGDPARVRLPAHRALAGRPGRARQRAESCRPTALTLAEILSAEGIHDRRLRLRDTRCSGGFRVSEQGFDAVRRRVARIPGDRWPEVQRSAEKTTAAVLNWLETKPGGPFFPSGCTTTIPTATTRPGERYASLFEDGTRGTRIVPPEQIPPYQRLAGETDAAVYVRRYDAEIRRVDSELGRLLDALRDRGLIAANVGCGNRGSRREPHRTRLFLRPRQRTLPPLAGDPPGARRARGARRREVDPRSRADARYPAHDVGTARRFLCRPCRARRLAARSNRRKTLCDAREGFSEARFVRYKALTPTSDISPKLAARDDRYTVILHFEPTVLEVYDRSSDPGEIDDLLRRAAPPDTGGLRQQFADAFKAHVRALALGSADEQPVITPALRARLDALADGSS